MYIVLGLIILFVVLAIAYQRYSADPERDAFHQDWKDQEEKMHARIKQSLDKKDDAQV